MKMIQLFNNEKIEFLFGPGGTRAAFFYGIKLVLKIVVFRVAWISLIDSKKASLPSGWQYSNIKSMKGLSELSPDLLNKLSSKTKDGLEPLLKRSGNLHYLHYHGEIVTQLIIERGPTCLIDDPKLTFNISNHDAFLGYLFTWPRFRKQGAAQYLINETKNDLANQGVRRIITHVRSTNVPSLAVFNRTGWKFDASLLVSCSGQLLTTLGMKNLNLEVKCQDDRTR